MKIDFDKIATTVMPNFKGGALHYDAEIVDDGQNKIMRGHLEPGASIGMHRHEGSSEIIFITSGIGTVYTEHGTETIEAGMCHYCAKGEAHSLVNQGDAPLCFYAVVPVQS